MEQCYGIFDYKFSGHVQAGLNVCLSFLVRPSEIWVYVFNARHLEDHLLSFPQTTNRAEVDLQLGTQQKNSVMHAEALEMVMLVLAVIAGILLLRGDNRL